MVFTKNCFVTLMTFAKPLKTSFSATDSRLGVGIVVVVTNCV